VEGPAGVRLPDQTVREHYRDVINAARAERLVTGPLNPTELVEPRFVEQAIRELGLRDYWTSAKAAGRTPVTGRSAP
jgi:sulfonate transport system substrate-binding protein